LRPISQHPAAIDAFDAKTKIAIYALLAISIFFVHWLRAPWAAVLVDGAEVLPAFTTSAPPSAILWHVNARFNARCIWVTGAEGSISCMDPLRRPVPYPTPTGIFMRFPLDDYAVCCTCKCKMFHLINDLLTKMLSAMIQALERASGPANKWTPSPRTCSMQTGEMRATGSVLLERAHAAAACGCL